MCIRDRSGATIDIQGDLLGVDNGTSTEIIEVSVATAGTVKVGGDIKGSNADGAIKTITLSGPTNVYIGGDLTTAVAAAGNNIDINGDVLLTAATTLDVTANSGTIDFDGKIDSSSATNHNLTLKSAAGSITIDGVIGSTNDIGNLAINDGLTGAGAITLSGVGDISTPKIGITGTVDIGHTNTASVTLNGTAYNIDGDTTITTTTAADKLSLIHI